MAVSLSPVQRLLPHKRLVEIDRTVGSVGGKRNERKMRDEEWKRRTRKSEGMAWKQIDEEG
jgi:hypothetical protein